MEIQSDFKELLELFNAENVEYLIVGAFALSFHGAPRATGDMDLWVKPDAQNAQRVLAALDRFGFGSLNFKVADFTDENLVIQLGVRPVRIDIIKSITGVTWEEAFANRGRGEYGGIPTYFIGRDTLIKKKQAVGRLKDLADVEALGGAKARPLLRAKRTPKKNPKHS